MLRTAVAGVLAVGLMPLPAFAMQAGAQADGAMDTSGYIIGAAYAAANPAPEILGLSNPNQRSANEAEQTYNFFGDSSVNESPDPYLYNNHNGYTPGVYLGGRQGSPMSALNAYDTEDSTAAQNAVWDLAPHIILGTGSDSIPENEHDFYNTEAYARAAETANGWEANSYNPIGVTYNRVSLPTMIETMYRLAEAANEVAEGDSSLSTRYGDPVEIAKNYERYIVGAKGVVLQAINAGTVEKKTIALVSNYDSDAKTYTIITDGVAEGTATTNRYLEAVQGVTYNYFDEVGGSDAGSATVTADQLASNVDVIIIGGQASMDSTELSNYLLSDNLLEKTYYCVNWANGSAFGTTVNSVENAQNIGRILPCVYPEVLDQSDMIAYYYDTFYHIVDGMTDDMIAEKMDGVRNWNQTDSSSYTAWETSDVEGYDEAAVQALLESGIGYLNALKASGSEELTSYLTPTDYVAEDKAVQTVEATISSTKFAVGETASITATTDGDGELTITSSDESVATVDAQGVVTGVKAGTATITVTASATDTYDEASVSFDVKVVKAAQSLTFNKQSKTVSYSALSKAAQTVAITKATGAQTNVTYSIVKVNKKAKKFSINENNGKIKVKKGLAKGTYKVKVKATAAASDSYKAANANAVITIKVK